MQQSREKYIVSNGNAVGVAERIEHSFSEDLAPNYGFCANPIFDARIIRTTRTLPDVGLQAKEEYAYDQYGNITDMWEYDYGFGSAGPLLRRTRTTYLTNNPYQGNADYTDPSIHIRNLPAEINVFDGHGILVSKTTFEYDRYDLQPLQDAPDIVQHDGAYNIGYGYRGNLVKLTRYASISPLITVSSYNQYDVAGNVVKTIDGRGIPTIFDYSDRYGSPAGEARSNTPPPELNGGLSYAFPTHVTNDLGHQTYAKYDYYLGKAVDAEDVNGVVSCWYYNDSLDRLTQIVSAVNDSTTKKQTAFTYNDASHIITTSSDLNAYGDNLLKTEIVYDGLGRTTESRSYEDATNYILTSTQYDAMGRPYKVSYPHRPNDAVNWTTTAYDYLGRLISVTTPDDAVVTTSYNGNLVTVTDQSGNTRRTQIDALGRLTRVIEDPATLNYVTDYSYDALGNLRQVTQGAQTRTFTYDLLSRLISATNPENGTITYSYDFNGNLTQKTDARGVTTTMTYDALNRVISKTYSGNAPEATAIANATPSVNYFYDNYSTLPSGAPTITGGKPIGRLIGVTYGGESQGNRAIRARRS